MTKFNEWWQTKSADFHEDADAWSVGQGWRAREPEIESLRQQLDAAEANCQCELIKLEQQLAEKDAGLEAATQIINQYASELDLAIRQAKREALLEAAKECFRYAYADGVEKELRRMAEEQSAAMTKPSLRSNGSAYD